MMDLVEEKILGYAGSEIFGGFVDRSVLNFINIFIVSIKKNEKIKNTTVQTLTFNVLIKGKNNVNNATL